MLPKQHEIFLSKVIEVGDIKIAQIPFKEEKLEKNPMNLINVNMKSAPAIDQSKFLVNTSLEASKSLQSMDNKIEKLNRNIDQYKKDCSQKDNMIPGL